MSKEVIVDRFHVQCLDGDCWRRPCMMPGLDKGPFVQGRGYVGYHQQPVPVCLARHVRGCPHPLPQPDTETARCCYHPAYQIDRRRKRVSCVVCGNVAPREAAEELNRLPVLPGVPCRHERKHATVLVGWTRCDGCGSVWDRPPETVRAFAVPSSTPEAFQAELQRRLTAAR